MFKVSTSFGVVSVSFKYDTVSDRRVISAHIRSDAIDVSGVSACAKGDNFCKSTGRKVALSRALARDVFDRVDRSAIWEEYFKIHSDLRK